MNLETNDNVVVNVDALGNEEEDKKLLYLLKLQSYRKNIISLDEFNIKYAPLFQKAKDMNQAEMRQLSKDYILRIDPYNPVYIVNDIDRPTVEELLRESNVAMILPAIYNRLGTVNDVKARDGSEIGLEKMLAFNNLVAMDITDPFDKKKIRYSQEIAMIFNAMTDPEQLEKNKERAQEMARQVLSKTSEPIVTDTSESFEEALKDYQEAIDDSTSSTTEHEEFL